MSKIQIEKDFKELVPGANAKVQMKKYYKTKKKEMLILLFLAICLLGISVCLEIQSMKPKENKLRRNDYGGGKKEVSLEVKVNEEQWSPLVIDLEEKEYSKEEIAYMYQELIEELPSIIKMENTDLQEVSSDLNLVAMVDEYPFRISWNSSKPEVVDVDGSVYFENVTQEEEVRLFVFLQYGAWEKEEVISITVLPKNKEDNLFYLSKSLKEKESVTREEETFKLPDTYKEDTLQWRYPSTNSTVVLGILFLLILPFISYQKDAEIHQRILQRREELLDSYPEFISQLILYMEAGMSVSGALFRLQKEGQKRDKKGYLYEELAYVCRQMKNGLPEKEGYELLAIRCNLSNYRKLINLLLQHIQKGSNTILDNLRKEAAKAVEEKKGRIQKKGEEMGTKLLFPMMIMLLIVMIFIMVPALFSFQM